jgi:hypothetical protein
MKARAAWRNTLLLIAFVALTSVDWPVGRAIDLIGGDKSIGGRHGAQIVPVLDVPISASKNLLWCGAFQLAWNEACERFKGPISLRPTSSLTALLNRRTFDRRSVDEASIFVASGALDGGIVQKIKAGVRKMNAPESRLLEGLQPGFGQLICYARLDKELSFPKPFGRLGSFPLAGRKAPCFGFLEDSQRAGDLRSQTLIHSYRDARDFVIELKTTNAEDMLVLAKTTPAVTLRETVLGVVRQLQESPPPAGGRDVMVAPCVTFSEAGSFPELEMRAVEGNPGWFLRSALQSIDFKMNEKGVTLHSEARVWFACSAETPPEHIMILEPPFLLLMKRKSAKEPYLACWIANGDLLKEK